MMKTALLLLLVALPCLVVADYFFFTTSNGVGWCDLTGKANASECTNLNTHWQGGWGTFSGALFADPDNNVYVANASIVTGVGASITVLIWQVKPSTTDPSVLSATLSSKLLLTGETISTAYGAPSSVQYVQNPDGSHKLYVYTFVRDSISQFVFIAEPSSNFGEALDRVLYSPKYLPTAVGFSPVAQGWGTVYHRVDSGPNVTDFRSTLRKLDVKGAEITIFSCVSSDTKTCPPHSFTADPSRGFVYFASGQTLYSISAATPFNVTAVVEIKPAVHAGSWLDFDGNYWYSDLEGSTNYVTVGKDPVGFHAVNKLGYLNLPLPSTIRQGLVVKA